MGTVSREQVDEPSRTGSDDVQERGLASPGRFAFLVFDQIRRKLISTFNQAILWTDDIDKEYNPELRPHIKEHMKALRRALNAASIQNSHILYHMQCIDELKQKHDYIKAHGKEKWDEMKGNETY